MAAMTFLMASVAGCATSAPEGALIADPFEKTNREIHEFNVGLDLVLVRPVTYIYDAVSPDLVKHLLGNAVDHIRLPISAINHLFQGEVTEALAAVGRFGVNTLVGAGGLLDPATEFGLPFVEADFGQTLARAGVEEGPFLMLPFLGPSTGRDAAGTLVDFAINPVFWALPADGIGGPAVSAARVGIYTIEMRNQNFDLIDEIFYESEDSYVTLRSLYVQNRRRFVGGEEIDPESLPDIFGD
jgi:phospholipid-binding lipoprotein MlaA